MLPGLVELRLDGLRRLGLGLLQGGLGRGVRLLGLLQRLGRVLDLLLGLGQLAWGLGAGRVRHAVARLHSLVARHRLLARHAA